MPGRSSQKIGRFSAQAAQLNHRSVETVASGRKRGAMTRRARRAAAGVVAMAMSTTMWNTCQETSSPQQVTRGIRTQQQLQEEEEEEQEQEEEGKRKSDELNP